MANYDIYQNPTYDPNIRKLEDSDPVSATQIFNPLFQKIINNIEAVKNVAESKPDVVNSFQGAGHGVYAVTLFEKTNDGFVQNDDGSGDHILVTTPDGGYSLIPFANIQN
ncbi:MAG: hypothetical protein LBR74_10180 [Eubacterium sp.]|nr:hypothetical protein [Eubacterium sp.]